MATDLNARLAASQARRAEAEGALAAAQAALTDADRERIAAGQERARLDEQEGEDARMAAWEAANLRIIAGTHEIVVGRDEIPRGNGSVRVIGEGARELLRDVIGELKHGIGNIRFMCSIDGVRLEGCRLTGFDERGGVAEFTHMTK